MTDIIFSFDTEDFTSSVAADAIYREAEILREAGIKGGFCIVGLLAEQLEKWGRQDVLDALKFHEIGNHSYGHSLHPTINEYTDIEDFDQAYKELMRQETESLALINHATNNQPIYMACPPGNQKSYVAMYGYSDLGLPLYADSFCDTQDGRGVFYCNIFQVKYTYALETMFEKDSDEDLKALLDTLAQKKRAILYTHPNIAIFSNFWDGVNYNKKNLCAFGQWKECDKRPEEKTERFYENIRRLIRMIQSDSRFRITSYSELARDVTEEGQRKVEKSHIPQLKEQLMANFFPVTAPASFSISDLFLACRDFLLGQEEHLCCKVYGFLDTPYAIQEETRLSAKDIICSAAQMDVSRFLPTSVNVGETKIGPGDWLRAAMDVILGETDIILQPGPQLPSLDILPDLTDSCLLGWLQSDEFKNAYLLKRLRLQAWTMRFKKP